MSNTEDADDCLYNKDKRVDIRHFRSSPENLDEINQKHKSKCKNETGFTLKDKEKYQDNENKAVHTSQVLILPES